MNAGLNNSLYDFEWTFDGAVIPSVTSNTYEATTAGLYGVTATNVITHCTSHPVTATVTEAFVAQSAVINGSNAFSEDHFITVTVQGTGTYEYQLDHGTFQSSSIFANVPSGSHSIHVRDTDGCTDIEEEFTIVDYPKFFTPNDNDSWNIWELREMDPTSQIHIFDRYGKFLKQISVEGQGWDGTYNGSALPSSDYWFTVDYLEKQVRKQFKSHFSLKR